MTSFNWHCEMNVVNSKAGSCVRVADICARSTMTTGNTNAVDNSARFIHGARRTLVESTARNAKVNSQNEATVRMAARRIDESLPVTVTRGSLDGCHRRPMRRQRPDDVTGERADEATCCRRRALNRTSSRSPHTGKQRPLCRADNVDGVLKHNATMLFKTTT
ncbi:Hypothetical protein SMAX5B_003679 [Scophthalmus maximus]|uniref:Uncharacterized protein n=1 Tax=Scophthalmus maximus TaxID=52904 RepID=A0A2U9CFG7_SCOMX|nr:Hypothetical protein SMAX5B_003679 [Scophthalmus maximus]